MKYIIILFLIVNLNAQEEVSLDSLWNSAKSLSKNTLELTKDYSNQGKNILIEQTLFHGINGLVDNSKIKVNLFDIDDNTNAIKINLFLKGEDQNLTIDINKFTWGVTEDKKYIVFEDLDISLNMPWMQYIISDMMKRDNGYLKIPHNVGIFSLLYSIKPNIKLTYKQKEKEPFNILEYDYDKEFIKIEKFKSNNKTVEVILKLKGSKENLNIVVESYELRTANSKKVIVLQNLKYREFTKPWIKSIIDGQNNEIHIDFTKKLYNILNQKD
ncbi:MAG: hypothetical protein U9N59_09655 [Campylobacterota bacterium]|nr:hypothetical protein [Campylobacterota bacterium]